MIKYDFTKKDFKKYLKYRRSMTNIIFMIFGSLLYFYITYYLLFTNPFETFIYYLLYLFILIILILFFNELYCLINIKKNRNIMGKYQVNLEKDKIIITIDDKNYVYLNKEIKKIKKNKRYILIKYNNHYSLLFIKDIMDFQDFDRINQVG